MPVCRYCGEDKPSARYEKTKGGKQYGRPLCVQCWSQSRAEYQKAYRARHSERLKAQDKLKYRKNWEANKASRKRFYEKLKAQVYDHYGRVCSCCGETEERFLTIDHVNGDGSHQRKEVSAGHVFFRWIINNGFPKSLRILCFNCNAGRFHNGGTCPHQHLRHVEPSSWVLGMGA